MVLQRFVLCLLVLDASCIRQIIFFGRYNKRYEIQRPYRTCPYRYNIVNKMRDFTMSFNMTPQEIQFTDGDFFHYWMYVVDYQHMRHAVHNLSFHIVNVNGTLTVQYDLYVPIRKLEVTTLKQISTQSRIFMTAITTEETIVTKPESFYNIFDD